MVVHAFNTAFRKLRRRIYTVSKKKSKKQNHQPTKQTNTRAEQNHEQPKIS